MAYIAAGNVPKKMEFYQEGSMAKGEDMGDTIAQIVMDRFREAAQYKNSNSVYQGRSTVALLRQADEAIEKVYSADETAAIHQAFNHPPGGYYGLSATKTTAIANWKSELVAGDPGALVQIVPTPRPRLPRASVLRIKAQVKDELVARMLEANVQDPSILLDTTNGRLHDAVKQFLDEKANALRAIEQAKVVSAAMESAGRIQSAIRDVVVQGGFREAYHGFSTNQIKYGIAIMRFPYWQRKVILSDSQSAKGKPARKWGVVPTFTNVSPWNFFTTADGRDVSDVTACMEYREISKSTLVGLAKDSRYDRKAILEILEEYSAKDNRNWLFPTVEGKGEDGQSPRMWAPEETMAVIYHEGFLTGSDLLEHGVTGHDATDVLNVTIEVCCGRTIRLEVVNPLTSLPRSYAATKYDDLGPGLWNAIGVPGILHDSQTRINRLYHIWESNVDWSMRPPKLINKTGLNDAGAAVTIVPGGEYEVNDQMGMGNVPDPIRPMKSVSAQYQMLWPLMQQIMRQADAEVGVPDLSDMSTFGRGSLGELSARVSQAVRRVRNAAFSEDRSMKAVWQVLFEYVLEENPELVQDADLDMNYLGVVGLLGAEQEKQAKVERMQLTLQAVQAGAAPPEAANFVFTDLLQDMGLPTEALGMTNPVTENAIAIATESGRLTSGSGLNQVPQLDGRSGAMAGIQGAIAAPNGAGSIQAPPMGM